MAQPTIQLKVGKGDLIGGKYQVIKKLGEGGCGSVFRCKGLKNSDVEVAVKILENASDLARFRREAKVLGSVRHPHVVRLMDRGVHDGHPYLVLEYMEGGSVRDLMEGNGKMKPEEAAWVLVQTLRGLRAARIVHRDLKPENLLLGRSVAGQRHLNLIIGDPRKGAVIKVADFGLAKHRDPTATRLTNTGQVMGTPIYMSPEQCRNTRTVGVRSDIYSLGVILYEMVCGRTPFDANNAYDIMAKHCNDDPKYPRMDSRVKAICEKCLAKSPTERYGTLYALERDLAKMAGIGEPEPDSTWLTWVVVLASLVFVAAVIWLVHDRIEEVLMPYWRNFTR